MSLEWRYPPTMVETIPVLRSPRLMLRSLSAHDHAALFAMAHDDEVMRYMHEGPAPSLEDVAGRVGRALGQWELRGYGMMAFDDADGFVGRLGAFHPPDAPDPLLVYALCRRGWGKGYATEGVGRFLEWMSVRAAPRHLLAHIDPLNTASEHIARKFGATKVGTLDRGGALLDVWSIAL